MAVLVAGLAGICASANAQPGTLPATALEDFPHVQISNGLITAQVYPPGEKQLYRGTRFDHAGVVFHVTYKGQDFSTYWFERFLTDPRETGKQPAGTQTACCATSGPVEEFAAVGFEDAGPCREAANETKCGRFLKPGIGIFKRDNDDPLRFPTLPALNEGRRGFKATKNSARFTQDLRDPQSGYGYNYIKTVTLVPGKAQMTITHVLKNTGTKDIVTTVYCHNFLTLSPGSEHMVITAPFNWSAEKPLQPELVKLDGKTIRYLAPIPKGVTTISLMSGFGSSASDYDFTVTNSKTGFGERIRADQPIVKINMWSITSTYSLEPYIAISLKPGETKRWTYTYDLFGPGEEKK
ncbi:MAG TPA: hypothetical protein VH189_15565 [Rhizomicrobium sp.]|nr:hypothetical protein [Rhizomicrobium sp.]